MSEVPLKLHLTRLARHFRKLTYGVHTGNLSSLPLCCARALRNASLK